MMSGGRRKHSPSERLITISSTEHLDGLLDHPAGSSMLHSQENPPDLIMKLVAELEDRVTQVGPKGVEALNYTAQMCTLEIAKIDELAADPQNKVICEIGFNVGHTSLRWLTKSQAHVYSFDLGDRHDVQAAGAGYVQENFPGRFNITWGDSGTTVPDFIQANPDIKCNVLFIDGGHEFHQASTDIANFAKLADPGHHVVMADDATCSSWYCWGPTLAWDSWVSSGSIKEILRYNHTNCGGQDRGWTVGQYVSAPGPLRADTHEKITQAIASLEEHVSWLGPNGVEALDHTPQM